MDRLAGILTTAESWSRLPQVDDAPETGVLLLVYDEIRVEIAVRVRILNLGDGTQFLVDRSLDILEVVDGRFGLVVVTEHGSGLDAVPKIVASLSRRGSHIATVTRSAGGLAPFASALLHPYIGRACRELG